MIHRSHSAIRSAFMNQVVFSFLGVIGLTVNGLQAADFDLAGAVRTAQANSVVQIPPGNYVVGDLVIPSGVTLKGSGYRLTTLSAKDSANGLVVRGDHVTICDVSIIDAQESGILVQASSSVLVARVYVHGCLSGLLATGSTGLRIENSIMARNRRGAVLTASSDSSLINCTMADNQVLAVSVSGGTKVTIFNNVFTGSPTGVWIAKETVDLSLDANLYATNIIGNRSGDPARASLFGWRRLTEWDAHSIDLAVTYVDPAASDYHPTSRLAWDPTLATTSDWGLAEFAGVRAPTQDIDGTQRQGGVDLGAYEMSFPPQRPADGTFIVTAGQTMKSAAIYFSDGRMLTDLFQNLPVPAGKHDFYFPSRDQSNQAIAPGSYELRVVESGLVNRYRGLAGNFAKSSHLADNCAWPEEMIAFDRQDRIYVLQNSFENGQGVRAFDAAYDQPRWMMPGGSGTVGWATDDQWIYYLQARGGGRFILRKIDLASGAMGEISGSGSVELAAPFSPQLNGMTLLGSDLFLSDPTTGTIYHGSAIKPAFTPLVTIPGATSITADERTKHLWVIAKDGELMAIDPLSGKIIARDKSIAGPRSICARNGRLAVLSTTTGKIHILDVSNLDSIKKVRDIGTGDGPGGMQKPDRFWFQQGAQQPIGPQLSTGTIKYSVSINSIGEVVVVDGPRISFWNVDGSLRKQGSGFWGQHLYAARWAPGEDICLFGVSGDYSMRMDCRKGTWTPDGAWEKPAYVYEERVPRHYFTLGKDRFAIMAVTLSDPQRSGEAQVQTVGFDPAKSGFPGYLMVRLDEKRQIPVALTYNHPAKKVQVLCHDVNHDGVIEGEEGLSEIRRSDGQPLLIPVTRYGALPWTENGDLIFSGHGAEQTCGQIVRLKGLDASGTWPEYDWAGAIPVPAQGGKGGQPDVLSPYDFKTVERLNDTYQIAKFASGDYAQSAILKSSGGTGLGNGAGTDIAGFGSDGKFRWLFKLAHREGSQGVQSLPTLGLAFAMTSKECDYMVIDKDGLGLGALAMPDESRWLGMWSDHAQQQVMWIGNDGSANYVLGDYALNGYHWFTIDHIDQIKHSQVALTLSPITAEKLSQTAGLVAYSKSTPPSTDVRITHLAAPMVMDGDLIKWRKKAIPVSAVITPETGTGIIGPRDCSAVLRLAWEGDALYVQTIVFDDKITSHQPVSQMFQQDGIEIAINGFMEGFKFNVARTTDHGPAVFRNRFALNTFDKLYEPELVPRNITIHADSQKIEERHLIETLYGIDLSHSPAIVTEFRLPLNASVAFIGDPGQLPMVRSGAQFYLGAMINDNDIMGGDVQKYLVWPATYSTFGVKTLGAKATLE